MSTQSHPYSCVLFDVDGTIVDSGPVVIDALIVALTQLGLPAPAPEDMRDFVGPPLWVSFPQLGVPAEDVEEAVAQYRSYYKHRCLEPPMYPGIADLIRDLAQARIPLATATSKQEHMVNDQMHHLNLAEHFTVIAGATPNPEYDKTDVVRDALARLNAQGADISRAAIVGDRHFDMTGARETGIAFIGASWGYAQPNELDSADHLVADVTQLRQLLLP